MFLLILSLYIIGLRNIWKQTFSSSGMKYSTYHIHTQHLPIYVAKIWVISASKCMFYFKYNTYTCVDYNVLSMKLIIINHVAKTQNIQPEYVFMCYFFVISPCRGASYIVQYVYGLTFLHCNFMKVIAWTQDNTEAVFFCFDF
jgi:hypothetical protein